MSHKKSQGAGKRPLGHTPFSHVKLEGPKKHHDFHGKDDSVPGKRHIPNEHWERSYDATDPSRNMELTEGAAFAPKCAKDRKTTYIKVNESDH